MTPDLCIVRIRAFEATPTNVRFSNASSMTMKDDSRPNTLRFGKLQFVKTWAPPYVPPAGSPVFPPIGHVRFPETYGPTGAEYQGTEQLPAAANVKTGVGYGASGAEFTGELDSFTPAQIAQAVWTRTGRTLT